MWKREAHCICSIVKAILILDNSSFLSIACWEDSDRANEKKVWIFSKLHSIIVNRKILYSDKRGYIEQQ